MTPVSLHVLGSINLDIVASGAPLPKAGETVTGASLARYPGGKGANQALAARRLGAEVCLIGRVGRDIFADEALASLRREGVNLSLCTTDDHLPTGMALIAVSPEGENQIVVASGANLGMTEVPDFGDAPLLCQLELPISTVAKAINAARGFVAINLSPALPVPDALLSRPDLVVVNAGEAAFYAEKLHQGQGLVVITQGAAGAVIYRRGTAIARATPPAVDVVDTTGAGDCFIAALCVGLLEGHPPDQALAFACTAAALATTRPGAQTAMPLRYEIEAYLRR
ncbi:MAG: ribokinase [Phenylobacterium zucineum]|nr:MAG: ribokinase [Phenylobacterium zucineum]